MPSEDALTPQEASHIATNAYFTLANWINTVEKPKEKSKEPPPKEKVKEIVPTAGAPEEVGNVHNRVLGAGNIGKNQPQAGNANPTLQNTRLAGGTLTNIHSGSTGLNTMSGFGYTLTFSSKTRTHAVIAMRGTRPEMAGKPDLLTDLRGTLDGFGGYGVVHKGFKKTFDSVLPGLARDEKAIMGADIVHCVGHSLGGAVATLIAAHYSARGKAVRLYTFGSPRVGAMGTHVAIERAIRKHNIYRVAHDLDPISLIGPFPYIHVNGSAHDANNFTIPSPTGELIGVANHDMTRYITSVGGEKSSWSQVRGIAAKVKHDDLLLARWLLHGNKKPTWVQYASAKTLGILFKLLGYYLRTTSTSLILKLTAVDLMAEMLVKGYYKSKQLGSEIFTLLGHCATWAGLKIKEGVEFTAEIIKTILNKMLDTLRALATASLIQIPLAPVPLIIAGGWALSGHCPL